jgi:hypothetical protein
MLPMAGRKVIDECKNRLTHCGVMIYCISCETLNVCCRCGTYQCPFYESEASAAPDGDEAHCGTFCTSCEACYCESCMQICSKCNSSHCPACITLDKHDTRPFIQQDDENEEHTEEVVEEIISIATKKKQ